MTLSIPSLLCYADAARFAAPHHRGDDETLSTLFYRNRRALDDFLPSPAGGKRERSSSIRMLPDPAEPISNR
jgi:hypothetical protein